MAQHLLPHMYEHLNSDPGIPKLGMVVSSSEMGGGVIGQPAWHASVVNSIQPCLKASEDQHTWLPSDPVLVLATVPHYPHS